MTISELTKKLIDISAKQKHAILFLRVEDNYRIAADDGGQDLDARMAQLNVTDIVRNDFRGASDRSMSH